MKFVAEFVLFAFIMGQIGMLSVQVSAHSTTATPLALTFSPQDDITLTALSARQAAGGPFDLPASARPEDIARLKRMAKAEAERIMATGDTTALETEIHRQGLTSNIAHF